MDRIANEEIEARLAGRAFFYQLAHTVFSGEPDDRLFDALASEPCRDVLVEMSADCSGMSALSVFCDSLVQEDVDRRALLDAALSDYNRVIAGLGGNRDSHPWESAYTSSKKLLFQVETLEVRNAYRAFGYLPQMYPKVADDHIALECAFLAQLAQKQLDAEGEEFQRLAEGQLGFLRDHLLKWIDQYVFDIRNDAPGSLYETVASALASFARADEEWLTVLVDG